MQYHVPAGFQMSGVHCGLKHRSRRRDVSLIYCPASSSAAGVYTQNQVVAAPVALDQQRTPTNEFRALVINSGNANACTGEQGLRDARRMSALTAELCDVQEEQCLVMSTGIIGEPLPMELVEQGIRDAHSHLGSDTANIDAAAEGMITTDTTTKIASRRFDIDGRPCHMLGLAKGSGMIGPNMATMLAVIMTDVKIEAQTAQRLISRVALESFNCIHVDGHTSTNDSLVLLSSGAATDQEMTEGDEIWFAEQLRDVCIELAKWIVDDGEGASHLIEITVSGCQTWADAYLIGQAIAGSPLVKTAIAGADPNWGRIVSAAGYAGPSFDPAGVSLQLNGFLLYQNGTPVEFDAATVSGSIQEHRETAIELQLSEGDAAARFWASDLTKEYVRINADYHT